MLPLNGCMDLTGHVYNDLTVVSYAGRGPAYTLWNCICICGVNTVVPGNSLRTGHTKSCGCFRKRRGGVSPNRKEFGKSSKTSLLHRYQHSAKARNIVFNLSNKHFYFFVELPCFYCGAQPKPYRYRKTDCYGYYLCNGIDRIDSDGPYDIENCVSCCSTCNYAKQDMTFDDFCLWLRQLVKFHT